MDQWWGFLDGLKEALPGFLIGDATATSDACFRCAVYSHQALVETPSRFIVVGCMSILAPSYTVYGVEYEGPKREWGKIRLCLEPLPTQMRLPAEVISRNIEATFGVSALPRDIAQTPIPLYVEPQEPPHTTLFHALFTATPTSLP